MLGLGKPYFMFLWVTRWRVWPLKSLVAGVDVPQVGLDHLARRIAGQGVKDVELPGDLVAG